jgi:hypothetical protein
MNTYLVVLEVVQFIFSAHLIWGQLGGSSRIREAGVELLFPMIEENHTDEGPMSARKQSEPRWAQRSSAQVSR